MTNKMIRHFSNLIGKCVSKHRMDGRILNNAMIVSIYIRESAETLLRKTSESRGFTIYSNISLIARAVREYLESLSTDAIHIRWHVKLQRESFSLKKS